MSLSRTDKLEMYSLEGTIQMTFVVRSHVVRASFYFLLAPALFFVSGCSQDFRFGSFPVVDEKVYRTIEMDPTQKEYIPVVKTVLVVDNSGSMVEEQQLLAQNSRSLADAIHGKNVEVTLLTTSARDNATSAEKSTHSQLTLFNWIRGDGTLIAAPGAPGLSDGPMYPGYTKQVSHVLNPSLSGAPIVFSANMSDGDFADKREQLYDAIVGVGIDGSDNEAGLCAIGRALAETTGPNPIFQRGDKAAFLLMSDANDFSTSATCMKEALGEKYRFVTNTPPPTQATVRDDANAQWWKYTTQFKSPATHRLSYTYETGTTFTLRAGYRDYRAFVVYNAPQFKVVAQYLQPEWRVYSVYSKADYKVTYSYKYMSTCLRDETPFPCEKSATVSNVAFNPANAGSPPAANGSCPTGLRNYVSGLLAAGQTLDTCSYTYQLLNGTANQIFSPAQHGNPATGSGNLACNASLTTLAQSMVLTGWNYNSCYYTYAPNAGSTSPKVFDPTTYGNPPSGSGNLTCNAALVSYAQTQIPAGSTYSGCYYTYAANQATTSGTRVDPATYGLNSGSGNIVCPTSLENYAKANLLPAGKSFLSCHYTVTNSTKQTVFNPASYGNPPFGSGNLACNSNLNTYAPTTIPASTVYDGNCSYTSVVNTASAALVIGSDPGISNNSSCMGIPQLLAQVQAAQPGKTINTCIYQQTPGDVIANCSYQDAQANVTLNLCNGQGFSQGGNPYANLEAYLRANPSSCQGSALTASALFQGCTAAREGYRIQLTYPPATQSYVLEGTPAAESVIANLSKGILASVPSGDTDFQTAIHAKASDLFSAHGYFVSMILAHEKAGGCTPSADSAGVGGERYYQFANAHPAGLQVLHPICGSTYKPALDGISEFIERTALTSYRAPISDSEVIEEVSLEREGVIHPLHKDVDYTVNGPTLDFMLDVVKPGDKIVVLVSHLEKRVIKD